MTKAPTLDRVPNAFPESNSMIFLDIQTACAQCSITCSCGELLSSDRQTNGQTDGQKVMHMSPTCNMHRWAQKHEHVEFCVILVTNIYYRTLQIF